VVKKDTTDWQRNDAWTRHMKVEVVAFPASHRKADRETVIDALVDDVDSQGSAFVGKGT